MGITKGQLKSIVKECLIEILSEGMGSTTHSAIIEASTKPQLKNKTPHSSEVLRQNASRVKMQSSALKEAIKRESGGNDIMASILADTAAKTLPTMLENESFRSVQPQPGGAAERIVASHDPSDLFGEEAASKWADLAFMRMPTK